MDVLVPTAAILAVGGLVVYVTWKTFQGDGEGALGTTTPPRPKLRSRRKDFPKFYRSVKAFTEDEAEGYDLDVDD
jgi:hypothetical protein